MGGHDTLFGGRRCPEYRSGDRIVPERYSELRRLRPFLHGDRIQKDVGVVAPVVFGRIGGPEDADDAREYLAQDLLLAQSLSKMGFVRRADKNNSPIDTGSRPR